MAAPATCLVFGAYGGIGAALARSLAEGGARVAVSGRDPEKLAVLAEEIGALALPADASDFEAVDVTVAETVRHFGGLDGVVNCAGTVLLKPAHLTRPQEWHEAVAANLTSAFAVLRAAAAVMSRQGSGGSVVLVSSAAASIGLAHHEAVAAVKGGIDALVRSAAATYGSAGVRFNAVAPGLVDTPLTARITGQERARQRSEAMHALRRIGTATEVAAAIRWLLSAEAAWITGQTLGVDGGLGRVRSG
jgi:3-oxoacyl-[acyl-carrier protein] reductase